MQLWESQQETCRISIDEIDFFRNAMDDGFVIIND